LDGRIVADGTLVGGEESAARLQDKLNQNQFPCIHRETDGAYSLCFCTNRSLLVTRDAFGLKPMFSGVRDGLVAVATDRKALWAIGIREARTFPPGGYLEARRDGALLEAAPPVLGPAQASPRGKVGPEELCRSLVESVLIQTVGVDKLAVGFSGGVDSTVLAKITKDTGTNVLLVTVGLGQTSEMRKAESTAREIGLPIVVRSFSKSDAEQCLDRMLWLIEEPSLMKISIAMAMHWTAQTAIDNGRSVILLGQGSDELFGGYRRFATILGESGERAAEEAISGSIRDAHLVNYQRDDQAVSSLRAELRLPFATRKMIDIAMRVPLEMKVRSSSDNIRKWILREAAIRLGVPSAIAMRPKKAIQHASGVEKAIREISRKHRLSPSAYLEARLQTIRDRWPDVANY